MAASAASAELIVHDNREVGYAPSLADCNFDGENPLVVYLSAEENAALAGQPYAYMPGILGFCSVDPTSSCSDYGDVSVYVGFTPDVATGVYAIDDAYVFSSGCIRGDQSLRSTYELSEFEVVGVSGDLRLFAGYYYYTFGGSIVPEPTIQQFIGAQVESADAPGESVRAWVEFRESSNGFPRVIAWGYDSDPSAAVAPISIEHITRGPDLNGDMVVDSGDLAELLAKWGASGPVVIPNTTGGAYADIDDDGSVGASDLAELLAAWSAP